MSDTRIFFATDIHGSERCFRKFLNAGAFYKCDVLLMGGDMTGKMLLPVITQDDGTYETQLGGVVRRATPSELPALKQLIANAGFYAYETTPTEMEQLSADLASVDALFERMMRETLSRWLELARERLADTPIVCFMAPGNDDPLFVDDVLADGGAVVNPEGRVVDLPGGFQMISVGWSNRTPWDTPRELDEDELLQRIEEQAVQLDDPGRAIFNLHVPPKDTPIDQAPLLDDELRPIVRSGMLQVGGVGSTAVRAAIERFQPMLSLHGHIHESRGEARIGRTLALNPGSEYGEGVLRGAIVTLSPKKGVKGYQLVAG
jgi:Icc-related predicted phosphoesterase